MAERRDVLDLADCYQAGGTTHGIFISRVLDEGKSEVRADEWATSAPSTEPAGVPILRVVEHGAERAIFERDGALVHLTIAGGRLYASVAAADPERTASELSALRGLFPVPDPSSTHEVTVTFWTYSPHGPQPSWRTVAVPEWDEIETNYADSTRRQLDDLMRRFQPAHGGQLLLWHGKAGTGKTFGLRALAWEWREWCDFHYIVDPDSFFGEHADYLMSVLLMPAYDGSSHGFARVGGGIIPVPGMMDDEEEHEEKPWRVLILEDTGELLTPDAKTVIGQGLSRFLNVVDGLIGQGLRVLVLVTTNEPIRTLHPAVARPGRCAANIEFLPLSPEEANAWLERHDHPQPVEGSTLLASLYAILEGQEAVEASQAAGFAGPA
jgi:ATPase family associated with various cellular activities (AAA)